MNPTLNLLHQGGLILLNGESPMEHDTDPVPFGVQIEFRQIQNYIFSTPILKVMNGANSLLGELQCHDLPELAKKNKGWEQHGNQGLWQHKFHTKKTHTLLPEDNPNNFFKAGILHYFGGHFCALFTSEEGAQAFERAAKAKIQGKCRGLVFDSLVFPTQGTFAEVEEKIKDIMTQSEAHQSHVHFPPSPWFVDCEWSGTESALEVITTHRMRGGRAEKIQKKVSLAVKQKFDQGKNFNRKKGETHDFLSKIQQTLGKGDAEEKFITNFEELIKKQGAKSDPKGDLAIIAIDGNDYGKTFKAQKDKCRDQDYLEASFQIEWFWYTARTLMREALTQGIQTCDEQTISDDFIHHPFRVMQLGGDDLLLVCAAEMAMPFLIGFEKAFHECQEKKEFWKNSDLDYLTFSAGLAIVPINFPFHAGHELADELLASAKVASRQKGLSVKGTVRQQNQVDWHVVSNGHSDQLDEIRQSQYQVKFQSDSLSEILSLTPRPYSIAAFDKRNKLSECPSLEELWNLIPASTENKNSDERDAANRKFHQMLFSLRQGHRVSSMDFHQFFTSQWQEQFGALWHEKENGNEMDVPTIYQTALHDLIEMRALKGGQ